MVKRLGKYLLFAIYLAGIETVSRAAEYYYADAAQTGSGHAGTQGDPFSEADMHDLAAAWSAGDMIYCKGNFGDIDIAAQSYGAAENWVIWGAWSGFTPECNDIDIAGGSLYLCFENWQIDKGWADDPVSHTVTVGGACEYLYFKDCVIKGQRRVNPSSGDLYPYCVFENAGPYIIDNRIATGVSNVTFENCDISYGSHGAYCNKAATLIFTGCDFHRLGQHGFTASPGTFLITDCNFYDIRPRYTNWVYTAEPTGDFSENVYEPMTHNTTSQSGLYWRYANGLVVILPDDLDYMPTTQLPIGSKWILDSDNDKFFTITGTYQDTAHVSPAQIRNTGWTEETRCIIDRCTFGPGLENTVISLNDGNPWLELKNSWSVQQTQMGFVVRALQGTLKMYGCTFVNNGYPASSLYLGSTVTAQAHGNILSKIGTSAVSGENLDLDYNLYECDQSSVPAILRGDHDIYGADLDTVFLDLDTNDLRLLSYAAARNAGDGNYADTTDYTAVANVRSDYAPADIGAYEYIPSAGNAPVFGGKSPKGVSENRVITFDVNATDVDEDPLTYYCTNPPAGSTFQTTTFTWRPSYLQADVWEIVFTVTDGDLSDSQTVTITVADVARYLIW